MEESSYQFVKPILYVANRGEIARRIIRSAKKLGFKTAVGYADQDADLPFVQEADLAIPLKGEEARDTYLNSKKVLAAALEAKATHLHPGYGFLSENPQFVDMVQTEKIQFVGPSSESMRLLGDKIGSRKFLKTIGTPLLPSYDGDDQSEKNLLNEATKLGFPLLIKPSAGGGGKGMLRVDRAENFISALESSKRISKAAFGDDRVFLEKLIENARHIEVQILADQSGNVFAIGERECSLQKRHQKVIEEAPCNFLSEELREKILNASKEIAQKAKYSSLGTVEWIWDGKDGIYFLEVNARLQVEHPVTEFVWKIDLVELQLRAALGESLEGLDPKPSGHSIEARLCAEDPDRDFLPSGGKIHRLKISENVRVDFGYYEKNNIPPQFDSLIGKVISFGKDREEARLNLIKALQNFAIFGPATNRGFLLHLLQMKKFISGDFSTDLISKTSYRFDLAEGLRAIKALKSNPTQYLEDDLDLYSPWGAARASEPSADSEVYYEDFGDKRYFHTPFADFSSPRPDRGSSVQAASSETNEIEVRSPMPARVIKVLAKKGSRLKKGDVVLVLEAMKMEHQIKATKDSVLEDLFVKEGDRVQVDALLIKWGKDS